MPNTSNGFVYPQTSDAPDVAGDLYRLANSVNGFIEQGTWTPQLGGSNATAGTGATVYGTYTRLGNEMTYHGTIQLGAGASFGNGRAVIQGLPYGLYYLTTTGHGDYYKNNSNGAGTGLIFVFSSNTSFEIRPIKDNSLGLAYDIGPANQGDAIRFTIQGVRA